MSAFAIIVDFHLKPGARSDFRRLVDANARLSVASERACRRFDVIEPNDEADRILLYEVYDNEAAFHAHTRTPHYERFDLDSAPMVRRKSVIRCALVCQGSQPGEDQ